MALKENMINCFCQPTKATIHTPFPFLFFEFTLVWILSCITSHIKTLNFIGSLLFYNFLILLFTTPLKASLLYMDLVEYCCDIS